MALLLSRTPRVPETHSEGHFADVKNTDWFDRYVTIAERYHIITKDPHTQKIRPNDPVNRAQFLKMMAFTYGLPLTISHPYKDVPLVSWYSPFAGIADHYKLFAQSKTNPRLEPARLLTYNEAALAIQQLRSAIAASGRAEEDLKNPAGQASLKLSLYLTTENRVRSPLSAPIPVPSPQPEPQNVAELRLALLRLVNEERIKNHLPAVLVHPALQKSAQTFAEQMIREGFFGHISPSGETLRDRMHRSGYYEDPQFIACRCAEKFLLGENLAIGQKTPAEVMESWMESSLHRSAILSPDFEHIGIGVQAGIWVEHFGGVQKNP
jgi:uncharacterized protein YkwD